MSCGLKVTQYIYQPTNQLSSIWMSVPKLGVCFETIFPFLVTVPKPRKGVELSSDVYFLHEFSINFQVSVSDLICFPRFPAVHVFKFLSRHVMTS